VISNIQAFITADSKSLSHHIIIARPKNKNNPHSTFLNFDFGLEIHFTLEINFWPRRAISNNTILNQITYATKLVIQAIKLAGSITAKIIAYVGLQLEKTGPKETQTITLQKCHFFWALFQRSLLELLERPNFVDRFFHKSGNNVIIQNPIIRTHENNFQTIGSIAIKSVVAFKASEKIIIDIASARIIIYGRILSFESSILAHNITGKRGNTQGDSIVKTPAKNETISNHMIIYC